MGSGNYESQILEAIQILVDDAVSKANYDKTIQGTISRCVDATIGKYIVKYQDSSFYAYSHNTETTYPAGASVYVLVPGNDMSKDKSIIGTVDHLGPDYVSIIEGENGYEVTGVNTINADGTFGLCSYKKEDLKILYDRDSQVDLIGLDTFGFEQYVKKSNSIICGATFKTALDSTQKYRGDYGIVFHLDFTDKSTGEVITKSYIVNVDNMTGNPYNYTVASRQYGIFDVDGANFISVKQIYLFAYNFPNEIEGKDNDIFISKVELSAANALEKEAAATCALTFVTPQGTYFDEKDIDEDKRVLQAQIRIKGKAIDNGSQNVDYYWFRENSDITTKSEKYNQYGGTGWECLNDSTIIQDKTEDNDAIVQWTRGNYQYITKKKDNVARETVYKCVAVYFDGTILSKTIVIYNYDSNYEITIQSDGGVAFHHDIGKPNLTCYINGQEELSDAYSYTWSVIDNNNQFSILSETTEANNKYSNAIEKRDEILAKVSAEQLLTAQDNENLALYNQVIAQHEYIMRVQDNKIHNLKVSSITNFSTYRCSVRKSGVFIGSASIIITNTETTNPNYTLIIDNGNQVFKYNEKGISPANGSNQNPQKIMPLSFALYDETGQKINHSIIKNIEWKVPSEDTLLGVSLTHGNGVKNEDGTTSYFKDPELNISIAPNYKAQYDKNEIQLVLNYNDKVITAKTNFTFVKEGESGTNGTDFVCKIVPYTSADSIAPKYPTVIYNEYTKQYSLNYTPFAVNKWFKVQLWHDGERIFEGTQSGVSLEEKNIEVQWSILQNTYAKNEKTNALITDNSNFSIDKDTAAISFDTTEYANPANIVKVVVKYNNVDYYATLPISIVRVKNSDYDLQLLEDSGFRHVMYTPDGQSPAFDNQPFELIVSQIIEGVKNDISHFETSEFAVDYDWKVKGSVYYSDWKTEENLVKNTLYESKEKKNQKYFKPVDTYNGLCTTNALVCNITRKGDRLASIHIPIHFYINRYGNAAMNGWDGNSISLDENGTTILAPQIGAGSKNDDNTFTGVFMGSIKEPGAEKEEHGLFGYHNGQRTITLNSQDGSARFGKAGLGQIVIDPTTDEAVIRSGVYDEDSGVGMEINLTEPSIKFASGKFEVDKNGNVTAEAFATKGDVKDLEESISYFTIDTDTDNILIPATADNTPLESKNYIISFKGKFKGKEITSFTKNVISEAISGITTTFEDNSIIFTVDKTKKIPYPVNSFTVRLTYTDIATVKTYIVDKVLTIGLAIQGKDGKEGQTGETGKSAYQIWLEAGNTGTEQDYLDSLKGQNADVPLVSKTASGNPIKVADAGNFELKSLSFIPDTVQNVRSGKNKIKIIDIDETTRNGVTYSIKDNILTVNGTVTDSTIFNVTQVLYDLNKDTTTYTLDIIPISGTWSTGIIGISSRDGAAASSTQLQWHQAQPGKLASTKEYPQEVLDGIRSMWLYINLDSAFNNFKCKIQLTEGSESDQDFEEYGASPTPHFPSKVETIEGVTNLADFNTNIITGNLQTDGSVDTNINYITTDFIKVKPNTNYYYKLRNIYTDGNTNRRCCEFDTEKNFTKTTGTISSSLREECVLTFTTSATTQYVKLSKRFTDEEVQLVEGDIRYPYNPSGRWMQSINRGKNILCLGNKSGTKNGIAYSWEGTKLTLNGTATENTDLYNFGGWSENTKDFRRLLKAGTYTFSVSGAPVDKRFDISAWYMGERIVQVYRTQPYSTITLPEDKFYANCYISVEKGTSFNNETFYFQLESGDQATQYEPYTDFSIGLIDMNKPNLFLLNENGWEQGSINVTTGVYIESTTRLRSKDYIEVEALKSYYISLLDTSLYHILNISLFDKDKKFIQPYANIDGTITGAVSKKITFPTDTKYIKVILCKNDDSTILVDEITNIQPTLYLGDSAEPYYEFVKISESCYDEFQNKKYIKRIKKYIFNGEEKIEYDVSGDRAYFQFFSDAKIPSVNSTKVNLLCSHFSVVSADEGWAAGNKKEALWLSNGNYLSFRVEGLSSVTEYKNWIKEQYNTNQPFTVYYELSQPEEYMLNFIPPMFKEGYNYLTLSDSLFSEMNIEYYTYYKGINGADGIQGETGIGVSNIIEQYYLSTSNTKLEGGSWKETQDPWASGKYVWTRSKITWTDGTVTETNAILAEAVNTANINANTATQSASSAVNTANTASNTANAANKTAGEAKTTADSANTAASNANKTAGEAKQQAATATNTANTANQTANNALEQANTANQGLASLTTIVNQNYTDLQNQIDGAISTWFDSYTPTNENEPAATWIKNGEQNKHIGDLFYITSGDTSGRCYRYAYINNVYKWVLVEDAEVTKAIESASKAQATADGKATIFTGTTTPTGAQEGDLWMKSETDGILTYVKQTDGTFAWKEYNKYTDNTLAQEAKNAADNAQSTADTAQSTANAATSTANTAKNTADTAKNAADSAVQTANTAKNTANTANQTATQAQEDVKTTINRVDVEYYLSTSATELNGGTWSTTAPDWEAGKYIWSRQKIYYVDTTKDPTESNAVCITGNKGTDGTPSYMHIRYSNDNIKFTGNDGKDIGSFIGVCTTNNSTAPTTFDSYKWSKTSDWAGKDKWRVDVYTRTNKSDSSVPTPEDFESETFVKSFLINDSQTTTWGYGNDFLAKVYAYVYCKEDFSFTSNFKSDDGARIELNDVFVVNNTTCTVQSVTLKFKRGWNKICLLLNEHQGDEYAYFSTKLSTHEKVVFMTAYEEDTIKVGEQGAQGPKGEKGENAPIPNVEESMLGNPIIISKDVGEFPLKTFKINATTSQEISSGKNLYDVRNVKTRTSGVSIDKDDWITMTKDNSKGTTVSYLNNYIYPSTELKTDTTYYIIVEIKSVTGTGSLSVVSLQAVNEKGQFTTSNGFKFDGVKAGDIKKITAQTISDFSPCLTMLRNFATFEAGQKGTIVYRLSVFENESDADNFVYEKYGIGPSVDHPREVKTVKGTTNEFDISKIPNGNIIKNNNNGTLTLANNTNSSGYVFTGVKMSILMPNAVIGKKYKLSFKSTSSVNDYRIYLSGVNIYIDTDSTFTLTQQMLDSTLVLYGGYNEISTISSFVITEELEKIYYDGPYGRWIKQYSLSSQLFDISKVTWTEKTTNNIEIKKAEDGTFSFNGTSNGSTGGLYHASYFYKSDDPRIIKAGSTIKYYNKNVGNKADVNSCFIFTFKRVRDGGTFRLFGDVRFHISSVSAIVPEDCYFYGVGLWIGDNSVLNNHTAKVLLKIDDGTDIYESYKRSEGLLNLTKPNLFSHNSEDWIQGAVEAASNSATSTTRIKVKDLIRVNSNHQYKISIKHEDYKFINIDMYDINKTLIGNYYNLIDNTINGASEKIIKFTSDVVYVRPVIRNTVDTKTLLPEEIINIKPTFYDYTDPYYEIVKLPNEIEDEHQNNKLIKRVEKIILDGTQTIANLGAMGPNGEKRFSVKVSGMKKIPNNEVGCLSNKFLGVGWSDSNLTANSISVWDADNILCITTNSTTLTLEEFKAQLSSDPVIVYYPLEVPVEYTLDYQPVELREDYNHITLNEELYPSMNVTYYTRYKGAIGDVGGKGDTGTGISSITEEYYLSTSKETPTGGAWSTTAPSWSSGKYIWTRSKIIYKNPESIKYTTPLCDSSWEAVNEIEIGGRNLFIKKNLSTIYVDSWSWNDYVLSCICSKGSAGPKFSSSLFTVGETYVLSFKFKKTGGTLKNIGGHANGFTQQAFYVDGVTVSSRYIDGYALSDTTDIHTVSVILKYNGNDGSDNNLYIQVNRQQNATPANFDVWDIKLEKGNKPTDWTPAPEDTITELANLQTQVDGKVQTYNQTTDPSTEWTTSELKNIHTGDLWYNSSTKKTQMWSGTAWTNIENAEAQAANALASKKAQVFTSTPTVPYYKGDLWVTALNKTGIVKTCTTTRTSGSYTASEWVEGLKYTDDTTANNINRKVLLLQGDSTNYSQLTDATASYWGFTADSTEDGHWYTVNTLGRDKFISDFYECAGGEKMLIEFEISTSCQGNSVQNGDPVIKYLGTTIGLYSYKANKSTSAGIKYAQRVTATAEAAVTKVSSIVTLPNEANCFRAFLQTEGWGSFSGTIKVRNITIKRHYAEKAYVDELVDDLQTQVDGKIQSYNQTTDPSTNWTATEKTIHTGDLWYNSSTKQTQRWSGTAWVNLENAEAQAAASLAGKKAQIFTGTPTPPYYKGDLWITSLDGKTGVVKTCKTARASGSYTASDWVESLKYTDDTTVNNMQIGGRNYISFGSGKERKGLFNKFSAIDPEDGYCTHRFVSKKTYTNIACSDAFLIKPREYVVGSQVVFSYDIMYTEWNFPSGANRSEFWFGQRYTNQTVTDGDKTGQWRGVTQHTLPVVGSNGCALNEWYHVEKVMTIPEQAAEGIGDAAAIQFYNSNADVEASFTLKLRNVKIELGNKATDWSPAPEDAFTEMDDLVASTETQFCIGTSATTAPAEDHPGWSTGLIVSNINTQEYLWSRIKNIKKSGEVTYSEYSCLIYAQKEMINQEIEYLLWNDNQVAPPANARYDYSYTETDENGNEHTYAGTNQWSIAKPTTNIPSHRYLWSRIHTTYKYTGATVESLAQSYTDYKLDSSWNKMFDLTGSLQANVNKILQDIQGGYVRITGGSILVGDNETNPKNLIIINHKGIAFFENPSGVWPDANTIENATSTWMIDGSLNMQDIAVTNLVASSIANQYLVLGNDNKNNADVAGDLDIYDRLGHVMFETILNSTEDYIDGFKIYKYKLNGSTMTPNGYINLSREYGFREYDAQGKMIFGNENGVFSSVANKTKQQIIADTNSSSVTYGAQMVPMRIIENEGKSNQIIHVGIAFLKL